MKKNRRPILPQVMCTIVLCFTICIFAPIEMVTLNSTNFWFSVKDFLPACIILFAVSFVIISIAYLLARHLPYALWLLAVALLLGITLGFYIQGNFLTLSGDAITTGAPDWPELLSEMLINLIIWLALIGASIALSLIKPKLFLSSVSFICVLILAMEGTALLSLLNSNYDTSELTRIYCSDNEQFTMSPNGDVIVIMLDTCDTRFLDRAIQEDPEYAKTFNDFTFYRNTSTSYPLTDTSFPSFMTGQLYRNEEPFFSYVRRAFRESRFFSTMIDNGMTVQVYAAPDGMFSEEQMSQISNLSVRESYIRDMIPFMRNLMCMIGYRYAPMVMHPFLFRDYLGAFDILQEHAQGMPQQSTNKNLSFLRKFQEHSLTIDENRRFFKFYLLQGAHAPLEMNRNASAVLSSQTSQYDQTLGCFLILEELFDSMKTHDIYDQATIIVMADHGINSDYRNGICSPLFAVKYPGEKGDAVRISSAPVQLLDMRATALYGAGIPHEELGTPAHEWEGITGRERILLNHKYVEPTGYEYYLRWITEFIVPEDATDLDSYVPSGRVFKKSE